MGKNQPDKRSFSALLAFTPYLKTHKWRLLLALVLMLVGTTGAVFFPYATRIAIDDYIARRQGVGLLAFTGFAGGMMLLAHLANAWRTRIMAQVGQETIWRIRLDLFNQVQRLPVRYFDNMPVGKVMTRLTSDVDALAELLSGMLIRVVGDTLTLLGFLVVMFVVDWRLALVVIATLPPLIYCFTWLSLRIRRTEDNVREQASAVNAILQENVSGIRVIQAFKADGRFSERFEGANQSLLQASLRSIKVFGFFWPIVDFTWVAGNGVLFLAGGYWVAQGSLTIGTLAAFMGYRGNFFGPFQGLSQAYRVINRALAGAVRIKEVLDMETEHQTGLPPMPPISGTVEFRQVTFGYEEDRPILKEISLRARSGQTVALVGHSGAGKTSIINLLSRFHSPQKGNILVDGTDINETDLDSYRKQVALVLQDPYLFSGTIRENLGYGRPDATDDEMRGALAAAGLADSFAEQGMTLDSVLQERGSNLSSGQRQLLSFARAILADPRLIILDEATAHVDTITERKVQEAMGQLLKGRTAFVIAHRLSTIQAADQILVIDGGRIVERGKHQELMALRGRYWRLCREQSAFTSESAPPLAGD